MVDRTPFNIRGGIIPEISKYKNPLAFLREVGSNVFDQAKHPKAQDKNTVTLYIYVFKTDKKVVIIDKMTGIIDMYEFQAIGTASTNRDEGKTVGDETSSYNNINPNIIGQKHVGKLSCLFASKTASVEYWSNNGKNGHHMDLNNDGWKNFEYDWTFEVINTTDALPHIGLKTVINDAKDDCLSIKKLEHAAQEFFGLLLSRHQIRIEITDVDKHKTIQVHAPADLDTKEITDETLAMSKGGNIRVCLTPIEKPSLSSNIRVYQKAIYVCSIKRPYLARGHINYNGLELNLQRENYEDNPEFEEKLDHYLAMHFNLEYLPDEKHIERKEKKQLQEIIVEVFNAISRVHADLLPELFGPLSKNGLIGTPTEANNGDRKRGDDSIDKPEPQGGHHNYPDERKSPEYTGNPKKGEGDHLTKKTKLIIPDIEVVDAEMGSDKPTIFFKEFLVPNGKKLALYINASRPASSALRKASGIERQRDVFYDKFIRAAYKLTYKGDNIDEFENLIDETWNTLYQFKEELVIHK